jgi:hypothetical protein
MFIEPKNETVMDEFYWMVTRFLVFELEHFNTPTLTKEHGQSLIERLINFHERLENYEICDKIIRYKAKMKDV